MNSEVITCDANNLYEAANKVRKSSPKKEATQKFMRDRLMNIAKAQEELHSRTWKIENMKPFIIRERGHIRKIQGNTPYDRMILHSYLDNSLWPELKSFIIYDNYASQVGKGVDLARRRFRQFLGEAYREYGNNNFYIQLIDFKKFYDNIPHQKLYDEIMRKIPYDPFHEYMLWTILDSFLVDVSWMTDEEYSHCYDVPYNSLDHLYETKKGEKYMAKGINIGNQASQVFSIFYLTRVDNYCKIVRQAHRYGRYMDDVSIIHQDKKYLRSITDGVAEICSDMGLFLNCKKTQLYRADCDFKYLNRIYRVTETGHIIERLAPSTIIREKHKICAYERLGKSIEDQYRAWIGSFGRKMTKSQYDSMTELYHQHLILGTADVN